MSLREAIATKQFQRTKNIYMILLAIFIFVFSFACLSFAGIANTKHNMSVTGPGTIKATTETEICVFCHIPHNAQPGRPLWNHDMPGAAYTMYTSEYLHRAGYTVPTGLGTAVGTPGFLSRQCLSCHDGTVAVGAVYMVRGTILGNNLIAMSGVTGTGTIPTTATGYIGTDLRAHHPVGIEYNTAITINFGSGSRGIELVTNPTSTAMKLYAIGTKTYVECSSCHDPHLENVKFLRDTSGATFAAKISNTCSACHNKIEWSGSAHQTSGLSYSDASVSTTFGTGTISSLVCMNCHRTHKGLGTPYLLRQAEETTCFRGASSLANETACHGSSASATTNRIQTVITRAYKHPTTTISGVHTNLDVLYPLGGTPPGSKGLDWASSKHAECVDCHNPHRAKNTLVRVAANAWYPSTVDATSNQTAKSGALTGVTGVRPSSWPSIWTVPTTFTTIESSTYEYEICFKCHSYWALRDADGITTYTTASGVTVTDQAMEFNPNNMSAHPVVVRAADQTGSYPPKALAASQMSSPWTAVGNQTMYCSDCHGADSENAGDPKGPHGANVKYMLKGTGKYWPTKSDGTTLWQLNTTDGQNANLFCKNCHPIYSGGSWKNSVHSKGDHSNIACVACHLAIPHGGKRSRLIAYTSDLSPYDYNNNTARLNGFKKASTPTGYVKSNCYSTYTGCTTHNSSNCGGAGCDP